MHDFGAIARRTVVDGVERRSFDIYVGGGLGTTPHQAKLLYEDHPVEELLPAVQSIARVFGRLGEKANRNRARIKFLVAKLGIDEFRRLVDEERATLPYDERWTSYLPSVEDYTESPVQESVPRPPAGTATAEGYEHWLRTNVYRQRQQGFAVATIALPLGDLSSVQTRRLAEVARRYVGDAVRTTVEQNIVLRWVREEDLPALHAELVAIDLADPGAGTIVDVTSCPGTDTCKLGIASSRGLAGELRTRLARRQYELDEAVSGLRIKVSGCFNSCGQHHVADIGFFGNSRKINGVTVPHFQVVLGGQWSENAGAYGLPMGAVPAKNVPEALARITDHFVAQRQSGETFQAFVRRVGKAAVKGALDDLTRIPTYAEDASFYSDWGDAREYTIDDLGVGECAGEVVSLVDFGLAASEREVFEAQLSLEGGRTDEAGTKAYFAMLHAAKALAQTEVVDLADDPERIVAEFRVRFHDTERFHDPFAGAKFANYLFAAHQEPANAFTTDDARRRIEEAQLFIEAAHACHARLTPTV
jgi:sulfite reductase (ferredoxin)